MESKNVPKRDVLTQKVFTLRKPNYTKVRSPIITEAEKNINDLLKRNDIESTANPQNEGDILVIFIHGFAASKYCWLDPDVGNMGWVKDYANDPPTRDFGWHTIPPPPYVPVDWTLSNQVLIHGASTVMDKAGVEWLTYSQGSAFGDIELSVDELKNIMKTIRIVYGERRIIIIAHSRGGLISKRYLDTVQDTDVEKLITFGTPFGGTFMSSMETLRSPSKLFLNRFKTARKLWDVSQERRVESIATKQMAPNSEFLTELHDSGIRDDIEYVNVAGSNSQITNVYSWRWALSSWKRNFRKARRKKRERKKMIANMQPPIDWFNLPNYPILHSHNWIMEPVKLFEIYPKIGYPEVMQGDGAVSIKSALSDLPEVKHYIIHKNHIDMTCCIDGYEIMQKELELSINNQ